MQLFLSIYTVNYTETRHVILIYYLNNVYDKNN